MDNVKILVKVLVLGDSNVGKTSLIKQYVQKHACILPLSFEADLYTKDISMDNQKLSMQVCLISFGFTNVFLIIFFTSRFGI